MGLPERTLIDREIVLTTPTGIEDLDDVLARLATAQDRDKHDEVMGELAELAPTHIDALDALYDSGSYYRMPLIWCLIGQTNEKAEALFSKAITDKDQYTRWAAAIALARCRTRGARSLLVAALKDRSHLVKQTAVEAMTTARFRNPEAVPQLEKIVASPYLQSTAPGLIALARKALRACQSAG